MTKEILTKFESATYEFCALAKSIPSEKLEVAPEPGEWPVSFVIHHLADTDAHFLVRFLNVLALDNPAIIAFDEESFPSAFHYEGRSTRISIAAIEASCAQLVDILRQLDTESWGRKGIHSENGDFTLSALLELATSHRLAHLEQLKK